MDMITKICCCIAILIGSFRILTWELHAEPNGIDQTENTAFISPTRHQFANRFDWVDATLDEVYDSVEKIYPKAEYLSSEDQATTNLQSWANQLDESLRITFPNSFLDQQGRSVVPKPKIRVMKNNSINAFSSFALTCYRIPVHLEAKPELSSHEPKDQNLTLAKVGPNGTIGLYGLNEVDCIDRTQSEITEDQWDAMLIWLNESLMMKNCRVNLKDDGLWFDDSCSLARNRFDKNHSIDGLIIQSSTPWVTVFTGLIEALKEDETMLVNALFHELAHFYRAHGALTKKHYNYYYSIDKFDHRLSKPTPLDGELKDLGIALSQLPRFRTQPVMGQIWHSELFSYNSYSRSQIIEPACEVAIECIRACSPLLSLLDNEDFNEKLKGFPQAQLDDTGLIYYRDWEQKYQTCLNSLIIDQYVNREVARKVFWAAKEDEFSPKAQTVGELAKIMSDQLFARDQENNRLLYKGLNQRLGFYTTEEEADYLAMDWLDLLNIDTRASVAQWLRYATLKIGQEKDDEYNVGPKKCLEFYFNEPKWTYQSKPVRIPVGSYSHSHHSTCFRIWTLDQRHNQRYQL